MSEKIRIAVLVSGGGTNLQALINAQKSGVIRSGEIVLVVSNNPDAYALKRAENEGIATAVCVKKGVPQADFEEKLISLLVKIRVNIYRYDRIKFVYLSEHVNRAVFLFIPHYCIIGYFKSGVLLFGVYALLAPAREKNKVLTADLKLTSLQ